MRRVALACLAAGALSVTPAAAEPAPLAVVVSATRPALVAVTADGRLLWRAALGERVAGAVAVGDRVAVALEAALVGFDAATGVPLWRVPLEGRPTAPVAHGPLVVAGTSAGRLLAVDPETGGLAWSVEAGGPISGAPAASGDLVTVGTRQREMLAVAAGGAVLWRVAASARVTAPTVMLPGVVYMAALDGRLTALEAGTGRVRWSAPLGGPVEGGLRAQRDAAGRDLVAALRDDGTLVAVAAPGPDAALRGGEPRVIWSARLAESDPPPAAAGGRLFLGGRDLVALDAASGRVLWRLSETVARSFNREVVRRLVNRDRGLSPEEVRAARVASPYELRGAVTRTPQVADGLVLAATDEGFLYAVDPATGELRWRVAEGD